MAIEKFWFNVRSAANRMVPHAPVDSPRLDRDRIEKVLRGDTYWLTPGSIKGYDTQEFDFLTEEERTRLEEGVREFKAVAESVSQNAPPTDEQVDEGVAGFRKVIEVLRPDKYADCDAFVLGKKLEAQVRGELPDWVREMVFKTGNDHMGEPGVWIWVEVEDFAAEDEVFRDNARLISDILWRAAEEVCPGRWPYVHFRAVSDQRPSPQARRK